MAKKEKLEPRKSPVQERSRMTVEAILDAAEQVFAERGFTGGTTNHIADRAGVSIGSLYQYFPNKDAIMMGLMERHIAHEKAHLAEEMGRLSGGAVRPRALLHRLVHTMVSEQMVDPALHRVLMEAVLGSPAVMQRGREIIGQELEELAGRIAERMEELPGIRLRNNRTAARMVTVTAFLLTHWFVLSGTEEIEPGQYVDEVTDLLARYLFE